MTCFDDVLTKRLICNVRMARSHLLKTVYMANLRLQLEQRPIGWISFYLSINKLMIGGFVRSQTALQRT
ncbi:hypothetical protein C481_03487 [Natrialba asiatica DSM 12278]|uniref:Uncharacterized protein n=1 Tax=Natrialba asiatica (strain ATCC 700177 / DSM 12278 / JCM 9576 / FERM P-10747 / NBRC 102637 / 172P1) TaxID=29540 RepID=M0B2H3_NATA1|nr:hypothetical protein C481_03487 [Natrialba asiatica DSM 12278]